MAAANTDKLRKKKSLFQTTLNGAISDSDTTLTLNSASGLPTDTAVTIVINRVDANGTATPSAMEVLTGVVSGSTVTDLLRAKDSTTAKSHANASVVEMVWDAATWNDFVDAYLSEHGQDGLHLPAALSVPAHAATSKATPADADEIPIVDSAASNVLKKLTWANLKATLKTYFDTLYVTLTGTQTLTNKTLTTPVLTKPTINGSVPGISTYTPAGGATATLDLSAANEHKITMPAGNITIAVSNGTVGQKFIVEIQQSSATPYTATWFTTIRWANGIVPVLTNSDGKRDVFGFKITGENTYDGYIIALNI